MFEKSAGRQFDFLTQMQLQTVKIAQTDALSQCFVDFLPVLRCLNHTNLNLYHYAGNNPVKYVDPDGKKMVLTVSRSTQKMNVYFEIGNWKTDFDVDITTHVVSKNDPDQSSDATVNTKKQEADGTYWTQAPNGEYSITAIKLSDNKKKMQMEKPMQINMEKDN